MYHIQRTIIYEYVPMMVNFMVFRYVLSWFCRQTQLQHVTVDYFAGFIGKASLQNDCSLTLQINDIHTTRTYCVELNCFHHMAVPCLY